MPLPFRMPVIEVLSVMAGVVVAVATVPAKPLADTTETDVTVPLPLPPPTAVCTNAVVANLAVHVVFFFENGFHQMIRHFGRTQVRL